MFILMNVTYNWSIKLFFGIFMKKSEIREESKSVHHGFSLVTDEAVFASYRTPSQDVLVDFMVPEELLEQAIENYKQIKHWGEVLSSDPEQDLQPELFRAVSVYKNTENEVEKKSQEALIWSILRIQYFNKFHLLLNSTQMINAFLILHTPSHKAIAQIKTGEGKSALLAIMMAFRALTTGKKQLNITSATFLAERDAIKFTEFFEMQGLTCGANVSMNSEQKCLWSSRSVYQNQIVYGTASAFQFAYLLGLDIGYAPFFEPSESDVYVDEVDALILDKEKSSSRIQGEQILYLDREKELYRDIWSYIFQRRATSSNQASYSLDDFGHYLVSKQYFSIDDLKTKEINHMVCCWFNSARIALNMVRDVNYSIQKERETGKDMIVIVDVKGSSELLYGMHWSFGLHEIISARENLDVQPERSLKSMISHSSFFNLFSSLFAVTGTIGGNETKSYLNSVYENCCLMTLPRYRASKAISLPPVVVENSLKQFDVMKEKILEAKAKGHALLFLLATIKNVNDFEAYAKRHELEISILTGQENPIDFQKKIASAGLAGQVLVATFIAGRGADIEPSIEVENNGGLGVFICSPPENSRVIDQNFGRTGRQGRGGFSGYILSQIDLLNAINRHENGYRYSLSWLYKTSLNQEACAHFLENLPSKILKKWQFDSSMVHSDMQLKTDISSGLMHEVLQLDQLNKDKCVAEALLKNHSHLHEENKLFSSWEHLREHNIYYRSLMDAQYARCNRFLFALQSFIFDYAKKTERQMFCYALMHNYVLINQDFNAIFYARADAVYSTFIAQTLVDIAELCEIDLSLLHVFAIEHQHQLIADALGSYLSGSSFLKKASKSTSFFQFNDLQYEKFIVAIKKQRYQDLWKIIESFSPDTSARAKTYLMRNQISRELFNQLQDIAPSLIEDLSSKNLDTIKKLILTNWEYDKKQISFLVCFIAYFDFLNLTEYVASEEKLLFNRDFLHYYFSLEFPIITGGVCSHFKKIYFNFEAQENKTLFSSVINFFLKEVFKTLPKDVESIALSCFFCYGLTNEAVVNAFLAHAEEYPELFKKISMGFSLYNVEHSDENLFNEPMMSQSIKPLIDKCPENQKQDFLYRLFLMALKTENNDDNNEKTEKNVFLSWLFKDYLSSDMMKLEFIKKNNYKAIQILASNNVEFRLDWLIRQLPESEREICLLYDNASFLSAINEYDDELPLAAMSVFLKYVSSQNLREIFAQDDGAFFRDFLLHEDSELYANAVVCLFDALFRDGGVHNHYLPYCEMLLKLERDEEKNKNETHLLDYLLEHCPEEDKEALSKMVEEHRRWQENGEEESDVEESDVMETCSLQQDSFSMFSKSKRLLESNEDTLEVSCKRPK